MTVYRRNPLLMTVMGANPGGPSFIVIDSGTGRVMHTKRATGTGDQAIYSCVAIATRLARKNNRSYIVFLDMSRAKVGGHMNIGWVRGMGITEEVHGDGSSTRENPGRRRRAPDSSVDTMIGAAWARFMSGVQVSVMEIPKIFRDIKLEMSGGMTLEDAVKAVGNRYRANPGRYKRNPIAEAILAGATSAIVSRAMQSNPHLENYPCPTCSGSLAYQGTLADREHYQCRGCGADFNTPITHRRRYRGWKSTCAHGEITNKCPSCRGRKVSSKIKMCPHGISGGGPRCVACQRLFRRGGPVKNNPAIGVEWGRLTERRRRAVLEFAGVPYAKAKWLVSRGWDTLPPSIKDEVSKGWQENPRGSRTIRHSPGDIRPKSAKEWCHLCGEWDLAAGPYRKVRSERGGRLKNKTICDQCFRGYRQVIRSPKGFSAKDNPGPSGKRRMTITVEQFANWVKKKNDPKMWKAFLAKFKGYEKWTHGSRARKVNLEWVDTPGVDGLWITYDGGKQPESTYIMPKGSSRKGAWKHPWDTMPDIKHDPQAGIVITKLRGQSKITDFYHK